MPDGLDVRIPDKMGDAMDARIIDLSEVELDKTPLERQAEELLGQLTAYKDIEVDLNDVSDRTIRRSFWRAAHSLGLDIRMRIRESKGYIFLRAPDKRLGPRRSRVSSD